MRPQPGIFALGPPEHSFLEFDLDEGARPTDLVRVLAGVTGPATEVAGLSVVVGFGPEVWQAVAPDSARPDVHPFRPVEGPDVTFPATQHDAWMWIAGGLQDAVFDSARWVIGQLAGVATVASELRGWIYQHKRDLTGFIDGTENPSVLDAPGVAIAGDGSSVLLFQKWQHLTGWSELSVGEQEQVIGRTKADSVELDEKVMPVDSHVSRNVVEENGEELAIYRRNVAYGGPTDHGTVFVGFCADQHPLQIMLERMAGVGDGVRDALTRYTVALSGSYYVCPAQDALKEFVPDEV